MFDLVDHPEIKPLGRFEFLALNGLISLMEPDTEELMQSRARKQLVDDEYDSPHSRPWHVSFHASEMPGDSSSACERYFLYRLMNIPGADPMPPWVTTCGTLGKAGELDIADAWYREGKSFSVPEQPTDRSTLEWMRHKGLEPEDLNQLGFASPEVWMTASTDLPVLKRGWCKPYIVEVKSKADEVLEEMLHGARAKDGSFRLRGPDPQHANQLRASIGLAHEHDWGRVTVCRSCWGIVAADVFYALFGEIVNPAAWLASVEDNLRFCPFCGVESLDDYLTFVLEPPDSGEIYYWSRSWPRKTRSFYYEHDQAFLDAGREVFARVRDNFILGKLPPRPDHFQWSIGPCGQCRFKRSCRLDEGVEPRKRKATLPIVTRLEDSNAIAHVTNMRPAYDYQATRTRVIEEWI